MNEHVILVAFVVEADDRETAHAWLLEALPRPSEETHVESWWVAEDDRTDGSDNDSAVFVKPGTQGTAFEVLMASGNTDMHNHPLNH
jgi:hypothetical protein